MPKETLGKSYTELIDGKSPWPEGYVPRDSTLKSCDTINMVLDAEQPVGRPGDFATMDEVPNIDYARNNMAIQADWKADCTNVVTYKVKDGIELPTKIGPIGPQIDLTSNKYLPGGGSQIQVLFPPGVDRMEFFEVVSVKMIN